jgi:hypothetical protein
MSSSTWSVALKELAEPRPSGEYIKRAIERAAGAAGLHYWRAFDIWYGKARRIDAEEAQRIEEALEHKRELETQNELHDLRTRLLKVESRIAAQAANSRRKAADPAGPPLPGFGGVDSAVAQGRRR